MPNPPPNARRSWLWPVAIAALIFLASSQSKLAGPDVEGSDKVVHFSVYGLLATFVVRLRPGKRWALTSILLVSLYGASDEWHQSFTPGRSVELADWIADTAGAALAVILYTWWPAYQRMMERPVRRNGRIENSAPLESVSKS
ncbi:MAG: VanZ family protein [Opitutus sp.]